MPASFLEIHPDRPNPRDLKKVIDCLKNGGVIIYPTDTIYGLGCDITNNKAVERICRIKQIKPAKANFSFICAGMSEIADYTKPYGNNVYRIMRKNLPGSFTFILNAANSVPKMLKNNKKTVGIRIPGTPLIQNLIEELGHPIMSTSIKNIEDEYVPYPTDPYEIYEEYKNEVDIVIDGGFGGNNGSTVIDCTNNEIEIIRQGTAELIY
jgi:tRNA threonylcarbamoyl adenosine modification protein (Sua5/YciO/YrdC/YwlC family)